MDLGGLVIIPPNYVNPEQALKLSTQLHRRIVSKKKLHRCTAQVQTKHQLLELLSVVLVQKMAKVSYLAYIFLNKAPLLYKTPGISYFKSTPIYTLRPECFCFYGTALAWWQRGKKDHALFCRVTCVSPSTYNLLCFTLWWMSVICTVWCEHLNCGALQS